MIDSRNFYDQQINDLIKQYDEVRMTRWWLYYRMFIILCTFQIYRPIAVDLSKPKASDTDPREI